MKIKNILEYLNAFNMKITKLQTCVETTFVLH